MGRGNEELLFKEYRVLVGDAEGGDGYTTMCVLMTQNRSFKSGKINKIINFML